jgi:hypothetical protein
VTAAAKKAKAAKAAKVAAAKAASSKQTVLARPAVRRVGLTG